MKVLVTGGAGFIGSHVVDSLIREGYEAVVIDNLSTGSLKNLNKKAKFYQEDIKNKKEIEKIFEKEKPECVFHTAAQINVRESIKNPIEDANINIIGSLNVLEASKNNNVKKIIFSSTGGAIYGDNCKIPTPETEEEKPMSPYGISKLSIEKYLEFYKNVYGLDYAVLRYSNVYGARQNSKGEAGVVSIFIDKILSGEQPIINGDGLQTRDYVYVEDVANANILAIKKLNGIFNVSTAIETSVNEIFRKIVKEMNVDVKEVHGDAVKGEQMRSCLSWSKISNYGWKPEFNLETGLKETINYFKLQNSTRL